MTFASTMLAEPRSIRSRDAALAVALTAVAAQLASWHLVASGSGVVAAFGLLCRT